MGPWWLYVIVFLFGYLTHKTFYFLRSIKISIGLIRVAQLISLAVLAKSMENFYYSHTARLRYMREQGENKKNIKDTRRAFNMEIADYKEKAILQILELHPEFYSPIVNFHNWQSAMKYLNENQQFVQQILTKDTND